MKRTSSHEQALRDALTDSVTDENGILVYSPQDTHTPEATRQHEAIYEAQDPAQATKNRWVGRKAITWTLAIGLVTGTAYATERLVVGEDINLIEHLEDYGKLPQTIPRVAQETSHNIEAIQQNADTIGKLFNQITNQGNK